jgi:hypothetical protein
LNDDGELDADTLSILKNPPVPEYGVDFGLGGCFAIGTEGC